jgi:hypothetical protein
MLIISNVSSNFSNAENWMFAHIKDMIIGPALPRTSTGHRQLRKILALVAFSPDALSSIAYANQEIYLGLIRAGSTGFPMPGRLD